MADEQNDQTHAMIGDPIPDVFPPEDPRARFVVAMSMANNDIDRAFRDLLRSADEGTPDFAYRVRVTWAIWSKRSTLSISIAQSSPRFGSF